VSSLQGAKLASKASKQDGLTRSNNPDPCRTATGQLEKLALNQPAHFQTACQQAVSEWGSVRTTNEISQRTRTKARQRRP
jgi:hypothetical protein